MVSYCPNLLHLKKFTIRRGMNRGILELVVLVAVCTLAALATTVGQTFAATTKAKESVPVVAAAKPTKQQSEQGQSLQFRRSKRSPMPTAAERKPGAIQKQAKPVPTELKPTSPKSPKSPRRM